MPAKSCASGHGPDAGRGANEPASRANSGGNEPVVHSSPALAPKRSADTGDV